MLIVDGNFWKLLLNSIKGAFPQTPEWTSTFVLVISDMLSSFHGTSKCVFNNSFNPKCGVNRFFCRNFINSIYS